MKTQKESTKFTQERIKKEELVALVSLGDISSVKTALSKGWDPNVRSSGTSPALKAAERNDLKMLRTLISNGAKVNIQDISGNKPLDYAMLHKNEQMVKLINETNDKESITSIKNENGSTSVQNAQSANALSTVF